APDYPRHKLTDDYLRGLQAIQRPVLEVGSKYRTHILLGMNADSFTHDVTKPSYLHFNTALLVRPDSTVGGRYDKIHRIPFGEYVPLRDWLPFLERFTPYDHDYSIRAGEALTRFALGDYHFGVLTCYEDTDPFLARQYGTEGKDGPAVDFLINQSND